MRVLVKGCHGNSNKKTSAANTEVLMFKSDVKAAYSTMKTPYYVKHYEDYGAMLRWT